MSRLRKAARWIGKAALWISGAFVVLAAITVLAMEIYISGFFFRTHRQSVVKAIKAESQILMAGPPTKTYWDVPKSQWPPTIASLKPEFVTVFSNRDVHIMITPFFDGGWRYVVPHSAQELPEPGCSEIGQGVHWCHPY